MIIGKRQVLLSALVLALGAAVFVNWYYTKPDKVSAGGGLPSSDAVERDAILTMKPQRL